MLKNIDVMIFAITSANFAIKNVIRNINILQCFICVIKSIYVYNNVKRKEFVTLFMIKVCKILITNITKLNILNMIRKKSASNVQLRFQKDKLITMDLIVAIKSIDVITCVLSVELFVIITLITKEVINHKSTEI